MLWVRCVEYDHAPYMKDVYKCINPNCQDAGEEQAWRHD
jgi:hypothetical protein